MKKIYFITGSQHLYGTEIFEEIHSHSREIAAYLTGKLPVAVNALPVVTTPREIRDAMAAANQDADCVGVMTWMHTFSPSKMWIEGFKILQKPLLQLNTQYNRDIPWQTIDMDFMNLNQSAHGDREHGFITARMRLKRKVVAGYWKDDRTVQKLNIWVRAAIGKAQSEQLKLVRFGDNMRYVAVTEGDKVAAEMDFGWSVNGYGVSELASYVNEVGDAEVDGLMEEYHSRYDLCTDDIDAVREQARYEIALERFLTEREAKAFTTTFEDLAGLSQLPGLAVQRLMEKGYGFGAEGDWKTSALTCIMKAMAEGLPGGTSFMEDYTYHFEPGNEMILGAHMLEVCPSVAEEKAKIEVHPLGIGGKNPPARMVFDGAPGNAVCVSLIDMGNRHRMIIQCIEVVPVQKEMPKLPVARLLWKPQPGMCEGAECWIMAGGAHHSCLSTALRKEHMIDLADMLGMETVVIDEKTDLYTLTRQLQMNDVIWR